MRVLFATSSWGLGHATRDLILLRALLGCGHEVTVLSTDRSLKLLRSELGDQCDFVDLPDIPKPLWHSTPGFYARMIRALPGIFRTFYSEHAFVEELVRTRRIDRVVSDSRYGVWTKRVPSYHLMHTLHQIMPFRNCLAETVVEMLQRRVLSGARKILVPDQDEDGLAGDLCHNLSAFRRDEIEYLGILSSVEKVPVQQDVDYFITVSGVEPQRTMLEEKVLQQARGLKGRVVIALGRPELPYTVTRDGEMEIHTYLGRKKQAEMLNRARMVVSRSGYTTLMELAEVGRKALTIPAMGQSEQEYLGVLHERSGAMHNVTQNKLDLLRDLEAAERYTGLPCTRPTARAVERFLRIIEE